MKTLYALAAIILLASCSSRVGLVKRKYNKGYYVSVSKKQQQPKHQQEPAMAKAVKKQQRPEAVPVEIVNAVADVKASPPETASPSLPLSKAPRKTATTGIHKEAPTVASSGKFAPAPLKQFRALPQPRKAATNSAKKGGSDVNIIVLVILSLFPILCLIAVYLHDGSITLNFWIDLLLHLTVFLEIIFALLVVLDVIDLA